MKAKQKFPPLPRPQKYTETCNEVTSQLGELKEILNSYLKLDPQEADWNTIGELGVVKWKLGDVLMHCKEKAK